VVHYKQFFKIKEVLAHHQGNKPIQLRVHTVGLRLLV
jgi:hypothetical protein